MTLDSPLSIERQNAIRVLGTLKGDPGKKRLDDLVEKLARGQLDAHERLDVFLAALHQEGFEDRLASITSEAGPGNTAPYSYSLQGGHALQGEMLFLQHPAAQCIRCHSLDESGSRVGPNLTDVGKRLSRVQLLEALVEPGKELATGYETKNNTSIMPAMGELLDPLELRDLIEYLASL